MGVFLIILAFLLLLLGGVNLLKALAGSPADTRVGAALFAALFLGVAIVSFAFGIGSVASMGRRRCPFCAKRISRHAMFCRRCHRAVPIEE